jgi:hypothetical protein
LKPSSIPACACVLGLRCRARRCARAA